ncbi:lisH domain-containing ARMC9 isoform X2 [Brachionus plicatilis]|uniref:LisH domain-containing protein ARMC9 n=1 Tax=Brachionus plicatilis TaxID=10195 RepID=A0A3M7REB7_BRAPC|nr:lisH domain-containing ARMC9 isoform X2 [Brachionus plicatilis]
MSGTVALEAQLNGYLKEYLDHYGFDSTLKKFTEECSNKGKSILELEKLNNTNPKINLILNEMIGLFIQGQRKDFFRRWSEYIAPDLINEDLHAQKLELELNIHFAVYPFRKNTNSREGMNAFKEYIENKGRVLCQTKEFLPYFGLPYHQNPQDGYPELFNEAWIADLQNKLEEFMKNALKNKNQPKLVELVSQQSDSNSNFENARLKQQLAESEKRTMAFMRKFNRVQSEYHSLIGITAELVDSLENSINGKPVSNEYIQNICFKLFNTQLKQTIDFTRPGTAGDHIRNSLAYQKLIPEKSDLKKTIPSLDFVKIKHDLTHQHEKRQLALLQALRWRLTKAESTEQRQKILTSYIGSDLLNFRNEKPTNSIIDLLKSPNELIKQFMARMINTLASLNYGRSYLASSPDLVKNMILALRHEKEDTYTKKNLLAALQKLSLRHNLHLLMINENAIDYLVDLFEDNESLSDYSLEYAVALFMNLTLKKAGKYKCVSDHKRILKVLTELLSNSSIEAQNYLNGALYSILTVPQIRHYAKEINLADVIRNFSSDDDYVNKQREVIINKINEDSDNEIEQPDDEEDDEDDEEDGDLMERELDAGETFMKQTDEISGENLLLKFYSFINQGNEPIVSREGSKSKLQNELINESTLLNKPTTPLSVRNSQVIQSKNFEKSQSKNNSLSQSLAPAKKDNLKASLSFNKTQSREKFGKKLTDSKNKSNFPSINSNDIRSIDSYEPVYTNVQDSNDAFRNKPKIQRTPDHSVRQKSVIASSIQSNSSYVPKYSVSEPRPSSASSNKSKNSPNSSNTLNQN